MSDPFLIEGPALISFSGGRTSAYMLWRIIQAHGGVLPPGVIVAFANTGREDERTLRFVYECGQRWGAPVSWVEWRDSAVGFETVGFNSASRAGEPFAALIAKKQFLPNAVTRFCTTKLKVEVMKRLMRSLGYDHWLNVVGLRHDEGLRVLKQLERNSQNKERWTSVMPLATAKITKRDVMRFWLGDNVDPINPTHRLPQGFDLGLRDYEGNCDLCFLKSIGAKKRIMRDRPEATAWWIDQERAISPKKPSGARFTTEYSYADLLNAVRRQPYLPELLDDEEYDAECGLACAYGDES